MIQSMQARLAFIHCLLEGDRGQLKGSILVDASMQAAGRSPLSPVFNGPHTKNSSICRHIKRATPSISLKQVNNPQHQSSMLLLARSQLSKSRCKLKNKTVAYTESQHCASVPSDLMQKLRQITWLLFSAWLFLLESGKWMWHPVSSITFLMLLPPLPITCECSVWETSIFNVTRLLYMEIMNHFLMQEKGRNNSLKHFANKRKELTISHPLENLVDSYLIRLSQLKCLISINFSVIIRKKNSLMVSYIFQRTVIFFMNIFFMQSSL